MRYDIHFKQNILSKIQTVVNEIKEWDQETNINDKEINRLVEYVNYFDHCKAPDRKFIISGADGSGDFPIATYDDSFIYLVTALARTYQGTTEGRLKELEVTGCDLTDILWLPEDDTERREKYDEFFESLAGQDLIQFINESDYISLREKVKKGHTTAEQLSELLIKPAAHDSGNIRVQLMSAAEMCTLIRVLKSEILPTYLIADTTMTLPLVNQSGCLFYEIVKRYLCKKAREKKVCFMAISKSHNMPHMEQIENAIREKGNTEHWYMRIPSKEYDGFTPVFLGDRLIPPIGGITYIFRFHKTTPVMRVDFDEFYWKENIWHSDKVIMKQREVQIFRDLDFTSHDQRCYGYPYPIKASHDMVSMTKGEREAFRKQIIDEAERAGLKRKKFIDSSMLTGHK